MLPPHSTRPTRRPRKRSGWLDDRGQAGGAGALGHGLLDLQQLQDRGLDRRLLDQQHVVDQPLDDRQGEVARLLDRDALGDGRAARAAPAARAGAGRPRGRARPRRRRPRSRACSALAAVAMPPISPPPPIGTTSTSRSGAASSISSASVPWPAITAASSKGWTKVRPLGSASAQACRAASSTPAPSSTTRAPKRRVFSTFTNGVWRGITMVAGMPRRRAW